MPKVAKKAASRKKASKAHAEPASADTPARTLPRAQWSGTLSFGLVTIPVELYSATRSTRKSLRMLAPDGTPLSRRYFSSDGKPLSRDDLERGYELSDGKFVVIEDEELERLLPEQSRDIDLTEFVPRGSIPPLFFDRAYVLAPGEGTSSAYRLLASTMERLDKAGIATFVMRERQYIVAITARDGLLRAETLRFVDELRTPDSVGLPAVEEPSASLLREMKAAVKELSEARVAESELKDSYWQRLEKLVAQKKAQHKDVVPAPEKDVPEDEGAEIIDLVAVLRQSLASHKTADHGAPVKVGAKHARPARAAKTAARR